MIETVTVNAAALHEVLAALTGPGHLIRELQVTRGLPGVENAIDTLIKEYYAAPPVEPVACKGIPRKGCNYLAYADTVCNKCGEIHHHHQMMAHFYAAPPAPAAVPPECWACNDTGVVTASSNGSGLIEAPCAKCEETKP